MLGAKKEQLETGSGAHKIERIRLATGVADPRLPKRDLKRRRRRAQRLDHLREEVSGLFHLHGCSGCRSDPKREIGRASRGERVCHDVSISVVDVPLEKNKTREK